MPQPWPSHSTLVRISVHQTVLITASCKYSTQTKFCKWLFCSLTSVFHPTFNFYKGVEKSCRKLLGVRSYRVTTFGVGRCWHRVLLTAASPAACPVPALQLCGQAVIQIRESIQLKNNWTDKMVTSAQERGMGMKSNSRQWLGGWNHPFQQHSRHMPN